MTAWDFKKQITFLFYSVISRNKIPLDFLDYVISSQNESSCVLEHDYAYHDYYDGDETVMDVSDHNVPLSRLSHNVHVAKGVMGYGWGKTVSIVIDSPAPGRWFAAVALLGGATTSRRIQLKVIDM